MLAIVEKNMLSLQTNCSSVSEEVDEIYRRLAKALKDRTEFLRGKQVQYIKIMRSIYSPDCKMFI